MPVTPSGKYGIYAMTSGNDAITGWIAVNNFWWVTKAGSAKGNSLHITDTASNISITAVAVSSNVNVNIPIKRRMNGIKIKTIDKGIVYAVEPERGTEFKFA